MIKPLASIGIALIALFAPAALLAQGSAPLALGLQKNNNVVVSLRYDAPQAVQFFIGCVE